MPKVAGAVAIHGHPQGRWQTRRPRTRLHNLLAFGGGENFTHVLLECWAAGAIQLPVAASNPLTAEQNKFCGRPAPRAYVNFTGIAGRLHRLQPLHQAAPLSLDRRLPAPLSVPQLEDDDRICARRPRAVASLRCFSFRPTSSVFAEQAGRRHFGGLVFAAEV